MKKLLATLAALLVLALAAYGVGSIRWRPGTRAGPPRLERVATGAGELTAGAAELPIPLHHGLPIGGFARLHWASTGVRDPVHVRALVLSQPGASVALVSLEILLVPPALGHAVEQRVADLKLDHVVVAATHTHSGPGGYWSDPIAQRAALGPYDRAFADELAERAAAAVRDAYAARVPATLATGFADAQKLARSRGHGLVDGRLVVLRVAQRDGAPLAEVVLFPAHPTLLGKENELLSGDWPGALARASKVPRLFFQGAIGDQSARPPHGVNQVERYGRRVASAVDAVATGARDPAPTIAVATATAVLPPPDLGATPPFLRRLTKNVLYDWFPDRTRVAAVRLGPVTLLAVPAEPVAEVGRGWRERAGDGAEILSLANDYVGYVETQERMAEREGETVRTYYGPELESRLGDAVDLAADELDKKLAAAAQARAAEAAAAAEKEKAEKEAAEKAAAAALPAANPGMAASPMIGPRAPAAAAVAGGQKRTAGAPASVQAK